MIFDFLYWVYSLSLILSGGFSFVNVGIFFGKIGRFPGSYGRIGEIPHGRLWPDWGL